MSPRRLGVIAGAVLVAAVVVIAVMRYPRRVQSDPAPAGAPPTLQFLRNPAQLQLVALTDLDGRHIVPGDLRGKVVLVNFWATWCPPCREEIPDLIALQEKYRDHLQIIGISEDDRSSVAAVKAFAAATRMNYPVVFETAEIERLFPTVSALPTTFLLDREGRLVRKHVGMLNVTVVELETRALAGLPVAASIEQVDDDDKVRLENAAQANKIPGIDLSPLSPERKALALQKLNATSCTCGCRLTVAQCRIDDPTCDVSLPLAKELVAKIAGG